MRIPNFKEIIWLSPPDMGGENVSSVMRRYVEQETVLRTGNENPCAIYAGSESKLEEGVELKLKWQVPLFLNFWGWMPDRFSDPKWLSHYSVKLELIDKYVDFLIFPSSMVADQMKMYGVNKYSAVIPPGADTLRMIRNSAIASIEEVKTLDHFISVGRLVRHKNFELVIDALKGSNVKYLIVGNGELKEDLISKGKTTGVNVVVIDDADDLRKDYLVMQSAAMVVPSSYEGFGLPIVEAVTLQVPVIANALPAFFELFRNYIEYFYSPRDLRHKLNKLLLDDDYRTELITRQSTLALTYSGMRQAIFLYNYISKMVVAYYEQMIYSKLKNGELGVSTVYDIEARIDQAYFAYRLDPFFPSYNHRADTLLSKLVQGKTILDLGSATGAISVRLAKHGMKVTSIDASQVYLELAMASAKKNGVEINFIQMDVEDLEFQDERFDNVWAGEIIEHMQDPSKLISEALRVLCIGGRFLFSLPASDTLDDFGHVCTFPDKASVEELFLKFKNFELKELDRIDNPRRKENTEYRNWFGWGVKHGIKDNPLH